MTANTPPPSAPPAPEEEMGESYTVTPDELAELQSAGTVVLASGCTLTLDQQEEDAPPIPEAGGDQEELTQ
jgi:hypothetical protein